MATFPKPLCELRILWGERESPPRPTSRQAEPRKPIATALPRQAFPKAEEGAKNREGE